MKLTVASSPHIRGNFRTNRIMLDVVLALMPALIVGIGKYGVQALIVTAVSILSAVTTEYLYSLIMKKRNTVVDCSAIVTGILLAMTLPATVPVWQVVIGNVFAILFVKLLCGGLGQNIFNPALAGRALMMILWPVSLTRFFESGVDGVSAATPLHHMVMPAIPEISLYDLFLGNVAGCIGEVSSLALLLGGAYLVYRKVISPRIPLAYLGTVAILTLIFFRAGNPVEWMLYQLLSGGLLLGAIFMATDYVTSPVTRKGQILYGIGCGILTVLFRYFGIYPEGVTYAILLMNGCVWVIDRYTPARRFGVKKVAKKTADQKGGSV